jgi:chromosome segregation ATPase
MTSFRRALFGYRRPEVDSALAERDTRIAGLEQHSAVLGEQNSTLETQGLLQARAIAEAEADMTSLSGMVIERERTIRDLTERLEEANACHDRSIASLDKVSARLEELQAQARGQATRIRMKALREAVEVSKRVQNLNEVEGGAEVESDIAADVAAAEEAAADVVAQPSANGTSNRNGNGHAPTDPDHSGEPGLYAGKVRLEIGPLGDFAQLVGFEDAVGRLGATDISVERFSEGRATFSMRLDQPVDLLRELESLSILDFKVRHTAPDNLILDIDEDGPERHAA